MFTKTCELKLISNLKCSRENISRLRGPSLPDQSDVLLPSIEWKRIATLDKNKMTTIEDYNTNRINDIMFTNSFEKYHLERAVSVEPIGDTDTALMR